MKTNVQFKSEGQTIHGKFYSASGDLGFFPTLLILSGFPGNENDVLGLCNDLSHLGLNAMTFNYRGIYQSEGDYSLRNTQVDIQAALDFLQDADTIKDHKIDKDKLVLGGWSYGGGMGLIFAANHPQIRHVFSIAGTDHGEFAREYQRNGTFSTVVDTIFDELRYPHGPVRFSGKLAIRNELIQNPDPYDLLIHSEKLADRAILLIGGWDDSNVVVERHILPFYRVLTELGAYNVRIRAFKDDHAFEESRSEMTDTILEWVQSL